MIVQERDGSLRLFRQLDHSLACGRMALEWIPIDGRSVPARAAIAIALHDFVWAAEDVEPVWDPETRRPVTFLSIPDARRIALYEAGLDRLEAIDGYAALLASLHFSRFAEEPEWTDFRRAEAIRRKRAARSLNMADDDPELLAHFDLLRHLDDLSLFACLGGPASRDVPDWLTADRVAASADGRRHVPEWIDARTIRLRPFPFRRPLCLAIPCRDVAGGPWVDAASLAQAWGEAVPRAHEVRLVAE
jgi:hypothetical protein